jgi:hypothetical protein
MSYYREQLEAWLKTIKVNTERVLDLGGASNPVRGRVGLWNVQECTFFDLGKEKAVTQYIPFDINIPLEPQLPGYKRFINNVSIQTDANLALKKLYSLFQFDAVFCLEVFEYVWNPIQALYNIYNLMTNDSVAYISFPAIYPVHNPIEIDYLRYTKQVIEKYLDIIGFSNIEITPRVATKGRASLSRFYSEEGMHPVRGSSLPFDIGYLVKARKLNVK